MPEPRRTYGPTVALGVAGAGLATVAGAQRSVSVRGPAGQPEVVGLIQSVGQLPLVTTLGLVTLAAWGVLLVTRGWVRRTGGVVGALASIGVLAAVVGGRWTLPDQTAESYADLGYQVASVDFTWWWWLGLVGAVVAAAAMVVGVWWLRDWPEMGTRYDTPTDRCDPAPAEGVARSGSSRPSEPDSEPSGIDLWKAIDQGRDPTA